MSIDIDPVVRVESLSEVVYANLHDAIVSRALPAGARLTEANIANRLQVSKTPVREALLRLREIGLIEPDGARGSRVIMPSAAVLRDAFEVRVALEGFAADSAAGRGSVTQLAKIAKLAQSSFDRAEAGDLSGFFTLDREFHENVAAASGNSHMARLIHNAATLMRALRYVEAPEPAGVAKCAHQHIGIAQALVLHDGPAARNQMQQHLSAVETLFAAQTPES